MAGPIEAVGSQGTEKDIRFLRRQRAYNIVAIIVVFCILLAIACLLAYHWGLDFLPHPIDSWFRKMARLPDKPPDWRILASRCEHARHTTGMPSWCAVHLIPVLSRPISRPRL